MTSCRRLPPRRRASSTTRSGRCAPAASSPATTPCARSGEELVDLRLQLFYKHRGVEKRAEGLGLLHAPLVAERISGTSAFAHSLALCQALEAATGAVVSDRARYLRTFFAELERLHNHVGYQADLCQATGLAVGQGQLEILKERLLRLN